MGTTPNQISAVLADADYNAVMQSITDIKTKLPFLIAQTPDERQKGFKLGDGTIAFLTKTRSYALTHPDWIPAEVDAKEWGSDSDLAAQLLKIRNELRSLLDDVDATMGEAGIEALMPTTQTYNNIHLKANNDVPGAKAAYQDLHQQFPGRKSKKPVLNAKA